MDWAARHSGNGAPRGSPVPMPCQSTLWQDLPSVRESGVLEQLTPEECKYQEVRKEGVRGCSERFRAVVWRLYLN